MPITADDLVRREVFYCVSSLVSTLAQGSGAIIGDRDLSSLTEQAFELACPVDDYERAARQEGWKTADMTPGMLINETTYGESQPAEAFYGTWEELCERFDIEPYQREVFEHWIVSDWLADKLAEHGEKVDKDFAGLTVWARTTTGQGIASDSVIEAIVADINK